MGCSYRGLFVVFFLLIGIGVIMVYSSSAIYADENFGDNLFFLKRHLAYLTVGFAGMVLAMSLEYGLLRKLAKPLVFLVIFLLILVLVPGLSREIGGARRWFRFGLFSFQPSQAAKIASILYLADFFSRKRLKLGNFYQGFLPPAIILALQAALILMQPDLGTSLLLLATAGIIFFASGVNRKYLLSCLFLSLPAVYFGILNVPYRRARIVSFLNPWQVRQGAGFQLIQSYLALGNGGILGVGLGQSKQKLFYLPAAHNDFVFSILGEELGLLGCLGVLILFSVFAYFAFKITLNAKDEFGQLLSLGIASIISLEAIINIGVCLGMFPTKGLPLPFISYGGSALVFNMIGVGLLFNVARQR
jgi:cell division protein FtsW